MDRRQFLAAGGLATAMPLLGGATAANAQAANVAAQQRVDFTNDGLGLDAREYAAQLQEAVAADGFEADYYSLGGMVEALEQRFARVLGKEAAMFVPTGTLANHLAIRKLAGNDRRVLVQAESHLYNDTGDGATALSGLNLVPLAAGSATIGLDELQQWVERTAHGRVAMKAGVLAIENPVRRRDHAMVDVAELERTCAYARAQGLRLHLDGARMFTLPLHSGRGVAQYAALFDTVYVSLWKHFNAASGAILAGSAAFIDGLYHERRMFGGSLPHAWPQVAVAARYLDDYEAQYARSWRAADELIERLRATGRFTARKVENGTSRFFLAAPGADLEALAARANAQGIVLAGARADATEMAMQVNPTVLRRPVAAIAQALVGALDG